MSASTAQAQVAPLPVPRSDGELSLTKPFPSAHSDLNRYTLNVRPDGPQLSAFSVTSNSNEADTSVPDPTAASNAC